MAKKTKKTNGKIPFPADPIPGKRIEKLEYIAPLWRYVSRYLFALSFAGLEGDEHTRVCQAVRAVDDGLILCGWDSGAFTYETPEQIQKAADKVMNSLPKDLSGE